MFLYGECRDHGDDRKNVEPPMPAHQIFEHVDRGDHDHDTEHQVCGDPESHLCAGQPEHNPGRQTDEHEHHELAVAKKFPRR